MKRVVTLLYAAIPAIALILQVGCSESAPGAATPESDIAAVESELRSAVRADDQQQRILYLSRAYDKAGKLRDNWPDSPAVTEFLRVNRSELSEIPPTVYQVAMDTRDLAAFKWAMDRAPEDFLAYEYVELIKIWKMGKDYRDYAISINQDRFLPVFLNEAMSGYNIRFFDQYIGQFKASGYRVSYPLQEAEFKSNFCLFVIDLIDAAMKADDVERIRFLLDCLPQNNCADYMDPKSVETMKALSDYAFYDLGDEALACRLIELRYPINPISLDNVVFGDAFKQALAADPEYTITEVLQLDEWTAPLTPAEQDYVTALPLEELRAVHPTHLTEIIRAAVRNNNTSLAMEVLRLHEEVRPLKTHEYDRLIGLAVVYEDETLLDYVRPKGRQFDIYRIELEDLGRNWGLFQAHAPTILQKIYPTMDVDPRPDGTTLGRIDRLLRSRNPRAVMYVIQKYDLEPAWSANVEKNRTLLMAVCEGGNLDAAKYLVETRGQNVNAETTFKEGELSTLFGRSKSSRATEGRETPLFFAARSGNCELIEYLISKGAHVNARTAFGMTPLMYAVDGNHCEAASLLLAHGAAVNTAIVRSDRVSIEEMSRIGIMPGDTAYRRAHKRNNTRMMTLLEEAGAVTN